MSTSCSGWNGPVSLTKLIDGCLDHRQARTQFSLIGVKTAMGQLRVEVPEPSIHTLLSTLAEEDASDRSGPTGEGLGSMGLD